MELTYRLTGVRPLLMHSSVACDPLSEQAKAMKRVSSIRKKSDDDLAEMAKLDWHAGFYSDEAGRPIIPADNLLATIIAGAKKLKCGPEIRAGVMVLEDAILRDHGHPNGDAATIADFWEDKRFRDARAVRVQNARLMRYRPIFRTWTATFTVEAIDVEVSKVSQCLTVAGRQCGLGDWRPRYGAFVPELISQTA